MKPKLVAGIVTVLGLVAAVCLCCYVYAGVKENHRQERDAKTVQTSKVDEAYTKGFFSGARAAAGCMKLNTNTGRYEANLNDLTDALRQAKTNSYLP